MVQGILNFEQYFRAFKEQYVIIGGTACDLLIAERGSDFRATKDLDMVLIVEAMTPSFGETFWAFIREAGYETWCRSDKTPQYYRFMNPKYDQYPKIIELFSRQPDYITPRSDIHLAPIHVDDDISSLSAILLNDVYYEFLRSGIVSSSVGVPVLDIPYLIAFKVKAWLDNRERMSQGEDVHHNDISKHKNDVLRLVSYVQPDITTPVPTEIYTDIDHFCNAMENEEINFKQFGLGNVSKEEVLQAIRESFTMG